MLLKQLKIGQNFRLLDDTYHPNNLLTVLEPDEPGNPWHIVRVAHVEPTLISEEGKLKVALRVLYQTCYGEDEDRVVQLLDTVE